MYFEDYKAEAIKPRMIAKEGVYLCKVGEITPGKTTDENGNTTRWTRIDLIINAEGQPHTSLFLTEGKDFDAKCTAFYDTFGIPRGSCNFEEWKDRRGYMDIKLRKKDGYTNMVPYFVLDENGWVKKPQQQAQPVQQQYAPQPQRPAQYSQPQQQSYGGSDQGFPDDIPF